MIGETISHYLILEKIGEGGMGVVYKAEDIRLKRLAALKLLPPALTQNEEAKERFVREARAAAALDHPNICTVYDVDEYEGQTFMAMAYIAGQSLKEKIAGGPLSIAEAVGIARQVAEGLRAAHEKGIIHRDIKPANIMLAEKGQAKIMDFGLAKLEWAADLTRTATIMGTVAYMSPEQARGEKVDRATDIWSLGCVLFEMLAGVRPFQSDSERAAVYAILNDEPPPISKLRQDVSPELQIIVRQCLQKDPRDRYRDAGSLVDALRSSIGRQPDGSQAVPASKKQVPSIAVMPFIDMSPQKDQEYFCDGIAEELINALTHIKELRVVARTSAFAFKGRNVDVREIGKMLNVNTVLEGSIRRAGNRLRITAQLISVEDGYHIWSERFDRELEDIFVIQDEISKAIVDNLKVKLLAEEKAALEKRHTDDPEAYNLYLKGLYFVYKPSAEAFNKALGFFEEAIGRDQSFALAWAGIANVYASIGILNLAPPTAMMPKAKTALQKALELDDQLAEAHAQRASIAFYFDWDWETADQSYKRATSINPGYAAAHGWYAWNCLGRGRNDEAIREIKLAQNLDPLMPLLYAFSVGIHGASGRLDEAIEDFHKATELDPNNGLAYFHAGVAFFRKESMDEAIEAFQKSIELAVYAGWAEANLGLISLAKGEREKAEHILDDLVEQKKKKAHVSSTCIAFLWGALGNFDKAFEFFDKAYEERDSVMVYVHIYTNFFAGEIQKDPRFKTLLRKMKLI
jgi:serine/threonine protein kinase/tetratricopeptide (TPR) repeat protein